MDAGHVLVAVLTSAAVGWLIWVEIHSRRNTAAQSARQSQEAAESGTNEDRVAPARRQSRRRDKGSTRTA